MLVVVVLVFSVVGGIIWTVTRQLSMLAYELPGYQENLKHKIGDLRDIGKSGVIDRVLKTVEELTDELQKTPTAGSESQAEGTPNSSHGGTEKPYQWWCRRPLCCGSCRRSWSHWRRLDWSLC